MLAGLALIGAAIFAPELDGETRMMALTMGAGLLGLPSAAYIHGRSKVKTTLAQRLANPKPKRGRR